MVTKQIPVFPPPPPPPRRLELQRPQAYLQWIPETASDLRLEALSIFCFYVFFIQGLAVEIWIIRKSVILIGRENLNSPQQIGIGCEFWHDTTMLASTGAIPHISWPLCGHSLLATAWGGINTFKKIEEPAKAEEKPVNVWNFARPNSKQILPWRSAHILYSGQTMSWHIF